MVEICTNVGRWKEEGLGMLWRLGKGVCRLKRGQLVSARPSEICVFSLLGNPPCGWDYRGLSAEGPAELRTYRMWQVCVADREATQAGPAPGGLVPPKELSFTLGVLEG